MKDLEKLRAAYFDLFSLQQAPPVRLSVTIFDKIVSGTVLVVLIPLWIVIALAYLIDGAIHPQHRGPMFSNYFGKSRGKTIVKRKFRICCEDAIDKKLKTELNVDAYPCDTENLTCVGKLLKATYLDELPQFLSAFRGDISIVGPRLMAKQHTEAFETTGHILYSHLKAGIMSETRVRKGTREFGQESLDYEYMRDYINLPAHKLLWRNLGIVARGLGISLQRRGRYVNFEGWEQAKRQEK